MADTDLTFQDEPAARPVASGPLLQWATGLQTTDRRVYVGWFVETARDEALDAAMQQAGYPTVTIRHASGHAVTHWALETATVFVLARGVPTFAQMRDDPTTHAWGIAYGWTQTQDGRPQSHLRVQVLLRALLAHGYAEPLVIAFKSTQTADMHRALSAHYDVLDAARTARGRDYPFYAFSIPIGPSAQPVIRGAAGNSKEITVPVALIPRPITEAYLREHWIARQSTIDRCADLLRAACQWSVRECARIDSGEMAEIEQGTL